MAITPPNIPIGETGVGHKIEFAAPSPDLAPYLGGFYSYHLRVADGIHHEEVFLPSWAHIRVLTYGSDWSMQIGRQTFFPVPRLSLCGPSSHAGIAPVSTGNLFGVSLSPRGWARLVRTNAARMADNIIPLSDVLPKQSEEIWFNVLDATDFDGQIAAMEAALRLRLATTKPEDDVIGRIEAVLLDPTIVTVEQAKAAIALPDWKFTRFVRQHFGFPPKLLIRRARFMRTILKIRETMDQPLASIVDEAYTDQSHFIRDCRDFLNMTPGQFAARFQPLAHAAFDAREKALGNRHHLVADDKDD
jgi:AraC-like DNA-binding protein